MDVFLFPLLFFFLPLVAVKAVVCSVKDSCHHLNRHISQKLLRRPPISSLAAGTFSNQCNLSGVSPLRKKLNAFTPNRKKKSTRLKTSHIHPACLCCNIRVLAVNSHSKLRREPGVLSPDIRCLCLQTPRRGCFLENLLKKGVMLTSNLAECLSR